MAGKRKYTCDYIYFKEIDNEEKAYWLGFIMADGCVMEYTRLRKLKTCETFQTRRYLQLSLSIKDINHLEKFQKSINSNHKIKIYKNNVFGKENKYCRIIIEDKELFDDLNYWGIVPNKSLIAKYPNKLNKKYDKYFIRGYFDGNGCLSFHKNRHGKFESEFSITGTKEIIESIVEILPVNTIKLTQRFPERKVNNYTVKYCGNIQTLRNMNYLYKDSQIYLDRKYEKFLELKSILGRSK